MKHNLVFVFLFVSLLLGNNYFFSYSYGQYGMAVELDQKVYTWTDRMYMTVVSPGHNEDPNMIDMIGDAFGENVEISTSVSQLSNYRLVETDVNSGIFIGEVVLTGFSNHDADGDGKDNDASGITRGSGPDDGLIESSDDDIVYVSVQFGSEYIVGQALVRWNIGEITWLEASYPIIGTGIVRVIDPDMNLNPELNDRFDIRVWSDSDPSGAGLTVIETNDASGIFEGMVTFTSTSLSSSNVLRVLVGDTITAEYEDNTLPTPYRREDVLDITGTASISYSPESFVDPIAIQFDKAVYTWTDKVHITAISPSHDEDPNMIDMIGDAFGENVEIYTRAGKISDYKLIEDGTNTGIFRGEVVLTGFSNHDANSDGKIGDARGITRGSGPYDGLLQTYSNDAVSVGIEYENDKYELAGALIRWNIADVHFREYIISQDSEIWIRVTDPDLNLNPEKIDSISIEVWSDTDNKGIKLTPTETTTSSGVFEGSFLVTSGLSQSNLLKASKGDTISAEYQDNTLPSPYSENDVLGITGTTFLDFTPSQKQPSQIDQNLILYIVFGIVAAIGGGVAAIMMRKKKPTPRIIPKDDTMFYGCPRCGNNTKMFYGKQYCPVCKIYL